MDGLVEPLYTFPTFLQQLWLFECNDGEGKLKHWFKVRVRWWGCNSMQFYGEIIVNANNHSDQLDKERIGAEKKLEVWRKQRDLGLWYLNEVKTQTGESKVRNFVVQEWEIEI